MGHTYVKKKSLFDLKSKFHWVSWILLAKIGNSGKEGRRPLRDSASRIKPGSHQQSRFWAMAVFLRIFLWVLLFISSKWCLRILSFFPFVHSFIQPKRPPVCWL